MTDHPTLHADFTKHYRSGIAIHADFHCGVAGHTSTVLFGPSGCGKTTILRCLAGLEHPESGRITFAGETWLAADRRLSLSPQSRNVGLLFQDYALFPHLTVAGNIEYGLSDLPRPDRRRRVAELLELFDLAGLEHRRSNEISGGQQQRVALARSVARRPRLLLLDEPLSALDSTIRDRLRLKLRDMLAGLEIPVIIVTHDRLEAITLADQIVVLDHGRVKQIGPVSDVFARPVDSRAAQIVGVETVEPGAIARTEHDLAVVRVGSVELLAVPPEQSAPNVFVCIRAEDVTLATTAAPGSARNHLPARITSHLHEGALTRVTLDVGFPLTALITRSSWDEMALRDTQTLTAIIKTVAIHLVPRR